MVVEGEISDGELTDLLAEGDDAALVSSRLRPSTLNRPRGFTERRHSQRIQSRTRTSYGVIPSSQPHTSTVNGFNNIFVIVYCYCWLLLAMDVKIELLLSMVEIYEFPS